MSKGLLIWGKRDQFLLAAVMAPAKEVINNIAKKKEYLKRPSTVIVPGCACRGLVGEEVTVLPVMSDGNAPRFSETSKVHRRARIGICRHRSAWGWGESAAREEENA